MHSLEACPSAELCLEKAFLLGEGAFFVKPSIKNPAAAGLLKPRLLSPGCRALPWRTVSPRSSLLFPHPPPFTSSLSRFFLWLQLSPRADKLELSQNRNYYPICNWGKLRPREAQDLPHVTSSIINVLSSTRDTPSSPQPHLRVSLCSCIQEVYFSSFSSFFIVGSLTFVLKKIGTCSD